MSEKILITAALLYANGPLHFGHLAGAYLPGDCYARFQRLQGHDVLYLSGSDEYGMAITMSAELAGRSPQEHVDFFHAVNEELFRKVGISFDYFARTTWPGHVPMTHAFFQDLYRAGHIAARTTAQLFSPHEGRFLADRYVVGTCPKCSYDKARGDECGACGASYEATELLNPRSKLSGVALEQRNTEHWFLLLDHFKKQLQEWLATKSWKPNVINFVKGYIDELHPRAITRDMTWGVSIPLPEEKTQGKVLYVWFDAPIGYLSAAKQYGEEKGEPDLWKKYWCDPATKLVQFIGKDNIPFHAAIFPAMIMGQKQPFKLVDELPANEFYNLEGKQFSKSEGWYIDLAEFLQRYSADQLRYALASNAPETADAEFSWKDFQQRSNGDLLGKYGNFLNRVVAFTCQHLDGCIPDPGKRDEVDDKYLADVYALAVEVADSYRTFRLRRACQLWIEIAQKGNVYFNAKKPWISIKEGRKEAAAVTVAACLDGLKVLALTSFPVIPTAAQKLWEAIGFTSDLGHERWDEVLKRPLPAGKLLQAPQLLFSKIEDTQIAEELAKLYGEATLAQPAPLKVEEEAGANIVTIEQVKQLKLCVAEVIAAERVPKSDKLLKLTVDDGTRKRTIVSGIALYYTPEQLLSKRVVIVANLKPATLRGIVSEGMLLAASWDDRLEVVALDVAPPGAEVS